MSKLVEIRLNGNKVKAPEGATILDVAKREGIKIPTLCHSPLLRSLENCRLCVVKVEGDNQFKAACSTPVAENMDITTHSPELFQTRKLLLELLLDTHYGDCLAPCSVACPASVDIQGYLALIRHGEYREAVRLIKEKIPMPASIGRVCPHFCEDGCRRHLVDEPISINPCKRFLSDYELASGERILPVPAPESGHKVAIIGGGPAGLSAAYYLRCLGHGATIFEAREKLGGMLRYGIPSYRLPKEILDWEIEGILSLGIGVRTGVKWGRDFTLEELKNDGFGAVFMAIGAWAARKLGIMGEDLDGVVRGIDFLEKLSDDPANADVLGRHVVVLGGGNVAIDAARSSIRLGAAKVSIFYRRSRNEMPAAREEIEAAENEGVEMQYLVAPTQLTGANGAVRHMEFLRMELGEPDSSGRRRPVPIEGSETLVETDLVISAIGQYSDFPMSPVQMIDSGLPLTRWGTIGGDPRSMHTGQGMVFVGGDVFRGPATVVAALADGRKAAYSLDRAFLVGAVEPEPLEFNISKGTLENIDPAPFGVIKTISRESMPHTEVQARITDFREVELGFSEEQAHREAGRCLTCGCSAAFDCRLRDMMDLFQVDWKHQPSKKISYQRVAAVDIHPDIALDPNKCIRCERCYTACASFQCSDAIAFKNWPRFNDNCVHCGLCVDLCPTGALLEKRDGRAVERLRWKTAKTHCINCGCGCELSLNLSGQKMAWISDGSHVAPNWASTCRRGRFQTFEPVWSGERVLMPLVREGGRLQETTWERAISKLLDGFGRISENFGAKSLGALASPQSTNESLFLLQKWMRTAWKSNTIDFPGRETTEKLRARVEKHPVFKEACHDFSGIEEADLLFLVGEDIEELAPIVATMVKRAARTRQTPFYQLTGRPDSLSEFAELSIQAGPELWGDFVRELLQSSRSSAKDSPPKARKKNHPFDLSRFGISGEEWKKITQAFRAAASPAFLFPAHLIDSPAADSVESLFNLAEAYGLSRGECAAGIYALDREINSTGALLMGISPSRLPGFMEITEKTGSKVSKMWAAAISDKPSPALETVLEQGRIKALFVQNAASLWQRDARKWEGLLNKVEFLVLQEQAPSPAMDLAQVVLPAAAFGEQEGTITNVEGRLLKLSRVFDPAGSSLADWEIMTKIMASRRQGSPVKLSAIQKEISALVPQFVNSLKKMTHK